MLLTTVHASATYRLHAQIRLYAAYDWSNTGYYLSNNSPLADPNVSSDTFNQYQYYEQRLTAGVRLPIRPNFFIDLSGGYAFDRYYTRGRLPSSSNGDRIDVGSGPFLGGQLFWKF